MDEIDVIDARGGAELPRPAPRVGDSLVFGAVKQAADVLRERPEGLGDGPRELGKIDDRKGRGVAGVILGADVVEVVDYDLGKIDGADAGVLAEPGEPGRIEPAAAGLGLLGADEVIGVLLGDESRFKRAH